MSDYYRSTSVRARFKKLGVDAGKATATFEVSGEDLYTLPTLALLVGERVRLEVESDQQVLVLDAGTGELEGPVADDGQMEIEEERDDGDEDGGDWPDLPPAAREYSPDDELDEIFGSEAA